MNYLTLENTVKIYIPSTIDVNQEADTSAYKEEALKYFSKLFGGATSYKAQGAWVADNNDLVIEDVVIVESKTNAQDLAAQRENIIAFAERVKTELNQEAVSVEINGALILVGVSA